MTTELTALDQLLSVLAAAGFEPVPAPRTYTRDELVRAIVGQQWAVAIALHHSFWGCIDDAGWSLRIGNLPCAVDVVDGKEGAL